MRRMLTTLTLVVVAALAAGCAAQPAMPPSVTQSDAAPTEAPETPDTEPVDESPSPEPSASPTPTEEPEPSETASEADPEPSQPPVRILFQRGDKGDGIRDVQHRLLQLRWFEGEITDTFGPTTQAAVEGFQAKRGLPVTGSVDETTYDRLREMTREPTHDELHNLLKPGPAIYKEGSKGDDVRKLQARMRQIGWYAGDVDGVYGAKTTEGIKGFQEKRGFPVTGEVDQRTLDKLNAMTSEPTKAELANDLSKPKGDAMQLDERCLAGRAVCISKSSRQLAWVVDGQIKLQFDVRFGSELTPTREGTFSVEWKSRDHVSSLYDSEMPFALFFSGGQAVHYSADFAARGYNGSSHGCVNVRDRAGAEQLFDLAKVGDKVIVY